jgi:hypothetical protein
VRRIGPALGFVAKQQRSGGAKMGECLERGEGAVGGCAVKGVRGGVQPFAHWQIQKWQHDLPAHVLSIGQSRSNVIPATKQLDEASFRATFVEPLRRVTEAANPPLDIWPYVRAVPANDLGSLQIWDEFVECVYRSGDGRFDLVHVCTRTPNVFLVIVVDHLQAAVHGHHVLDLNKLYGIKSTGAGNA